MRNDAELTPTRDNSFGDFRSDNQSSSSMGKLLLALLSDCATEQIVYNTPPPGALHGLTGCGIREEG